MFYIGIVLLVIVAIIAYRLQKTVPKPQGLSQDQHKRIHGQEEGDISCQSRNVQIDDGSLSSSGERELLEEPIISHAHEGGSIPKIERQMIVLLLSFAYGGFVFMLSEGPISFILALWNMAPLTVFAIIPERLATSRVFTVIHMISFFALLTFLTWMVYDLTYVHIDALNAIAFMTMPIITFIVVAVFYSLSLLVFYLKVKKSRSTSVLD